MKPISIFDKLKTPHSTRLTTRKIHSEILFQLSFDGVGAFVRIIDQKTLKEVEVDYRCFSGISRDLLKSIERVKNDESFRIDWEHPENRVYLARNEFMIWQLEKCDNIVDDQFKPVQFIKEHAELTLFIEGDKKLESKLVLVSRGEMWEGLSVVTEDHVFTNGKIFNVKPIGDGFSQIQYFETEILPTDIEKFLSLFYSYFDEITVKYKNFKHISGNARHVQPTIIFEKIDVNNSLYLHITHSIQGFDSNFLENYDVSRVVMINELENTIVVSDVIQADQEQTFDSFNKLLGKHKKELAGKPKNGYFVEESLIIIEETLAARFILKELPKLIASYTIFGAEKLKSYKVQAVEPKLKLTFKHGIDFLEGNVDIEINDEQFSLFEAINQYRKDSYILLSDGTHAVINQSYIDKLNRIFKKQKDAVKVSFFDLPLVEEMIDSKVAEESFVKSREIFLGFNNLNESECMLPEIDAELRPYQHQGYKWLRYLNKHGLGGCLADDMGLGKTLQAITMLASVYPEEKTPSLIIMPRSLLFNWESEFVKFKANLTYYIYYGMNRDFEKAKEQNIIITTYGMIRNDIERFKEFSFYYVILDESQHIKNINSQISRAVMLLDCEHRLALSGTPIENNLGELYSLFRFLNPSMFGPVDQFNRDYALPIQQENDKDVIGELKKKIYPFILRRLKKDVLKELPEKIEQVLQVDMNPDQKSFYEQRRLFYYEAVKTQISINGVKNSQIFIFQALNELRQIASIPEAKSGDQIISPKRELLMENLRDSIANGHKVLVFANFLSSIDHIAEDLEKEDINYLIMTGATKDRKALVERFQDDVDTKVFLLTLKTGGVGLNLTAADTIFIFDPWWNNAVENQAIDRAHRIGQDKTVFSYKLITKGTIEEKIIELQEKKKDLFNSVISSDSSSIKSLNETDVEFILGV